MLDGELSSSEEDAVRAHVATCEQCQRELHLVDQGRALVRNLPPVDPPFGFYERMLRPRRRSTKVGVAALVASAAASLAVMGVASPREARVSPHVAQLVDAHTASASTSGDPISEITPAAAPVSVRP
jgi:anti-sigma factor RsiW